MSTITRLLRLEALPASPDLGLLVLRLWTGLPMALLHGQGKAAKALAGSAEFGDPIGIGVVPSLWLAAGGEFLGGLLLALGLATRWAALWLGITMTVAFGLVHEARLTGEGNGELAFLYLAACVVLLLAGPGKFSVDERLRR